MITGTQPFVLGWLRDLPDFRDFTQQSPQIKQQLQKVKALKATKAAASAASSVDLRQWCSPVEDQKQIGSCTANAAAGLYEYFERRAFGQHIDLSRLFLYKVERDLLHWTGDTGAYLRTAMKAMVLFGVPPEEYWPYDPKKYDVEPSAFCYAFAQDYKAIQYYRFDPPGTDRNALLQTIKSWLAAGLPSMFGFTVYSSISQAATSGKIPFPAAGERVLGGHAIMAVGYDDSLQIKNSNPGSTATQGALLIRNSWGTTWGQNGYGYLPYEYVTRGLATDWWSLIKATYIAASEFQ